MYLWRFFFYFWLEYMCYSLTLQIYIYFPCFLSIQGPKIQIGIDVIPLNYLNRGVLLCVDWIEFSPNSAH